MVFDEGVGIPVRRQVVAEAEARQRHVIEMPRRVPVEPQKIADHSPEPGAQEVAPLTQQSVEIGAGVFQAAAVQ